MREELDSSALTFLEPRPLRSITLGNTIQAESVCLFFRGFLLLRKDLTSPGGAKPAAGGRCANRESAHILLALRASSAINIPFSLNYKLYILVFKNLPNP